MNTFLMVGVACACTFFMRVLPFLFLRKDTKIPSFVRYLGDVLPASIMAVLVVYCLRNVGTTFSSTGYLQLLAVVFTALIHLWKKNTYLSIVLGTAFYMVICHIF